MLRLQVKNEKNTHQMPQFNQPVYYEYQYLCAHIYTNNLQVNVHKLFYKTLPPSVTV